MWMAPLTMCGLLKIRKLQFCMKKWYLKLHKGAAELHCFNPTLRRFAAFCNFFFHEIATFFKKKAASKDKMCLVISPRFAKVVLVSIETGKNDIH